MTAFVQARNYHPGRRKPIRLIVWHDMESPESHTAAENVAGWFAGPTAPQASAHSCHDDNSTVECVKPGDTAWAAPNANADGYHVEQAGIRDQGRPGWRDPFSVGTIRQACTWLASLAELAHIPDRWLTDGELADGVSAGHTTHEAITRVLGGGDHTDPGSDFPKDVAMAEMVKARAGKSAPVPATGDRWLRFTNPRLAGADVTGVQHALVVAGNPQLEETGVYDIATADLVRLFQANRSIVERGVGPLTWAALRAIVHH